MAFSVVSDHFSELVVNLAAQDRNAAKDVSDQPASSETQSSTKRVSVFAKLLMKMSSNKQQPRKEGSCSDKDFGLVNKEIAEQTQQAWKQLSPEEKQAVREVVRGKDFSPPAPLQIVLESPSRSSTVSADESPGSSRGSGRGSREGSPDKRSIVSCDANSFSPASRSRQGLNLSDQGKENLTPPNASLHQAYDFRARMEIEAALTTAGINIDESEENEGRPRAESVTSCSSAISSASTAVAGQGPTKKDQQLEQQLADQGAQELVDSIEFDDDPRGLTPVETALRSKGPTPTGGPESPVQSAAPPIPTSAFTIVQSGAIRPVPMTPALLQQKEAPHSPDPSHASQLGFEEGDFDGVVFPLSPGSDTLAERFSNGSRTPPQNFGGSQYSSPVRSIEGSPIAHESDVRSLESAVARSLSQSGSNAELVKSKPVELASPASLGSDTSPLKPVVLPMEFLQQPVESAPLSGRVSGSGGSSEGGLNGVMYVIICLVALYVLPMIASMVSQYFAAGSVGALTSPVKVIGAGSSL